MQHEYCQYPRVSQNGLWPRPKGVWEETVCEVVVLAIFLQISHCAGKMNAQKIFCHRPSHTTRLAGLPPRREFIFLTSMHPRLSASLLIPVQEVLRNQAVSPATWQLKRFHSVISLAHGCCEGRLQAQTMPMCLVVHLVGLRS